MSSHFIRASLVAALLVTSVSAQTRYIPDNDATAGGCNVIPFGTGTTSTTWANQRYQTLATFADLGSPTGPIDICNIGFASCGTAANVSHCDTIVIQLAQTNATALTTSFAGNLAANTQTVLKCADFEWAQNGGVWERIGLDTKYTFDPANGRNLVLDITVTGNRKTLGGTTGFHTGARQRLYAFSWTGSPPAAGSLGSSAALKWCVDVGSWSFAVQGTACQNLKLSLTGSGELGQSLGVAQTGPIRLGSSCFMALGINSINPGIELAPGCKAYCIPLVSVPLRGPFSGTIPNDRNLICQRFCVQIYYTGSYPGGIATTEQGVIVTGVAQ